MGDGQNQVIRGSRVIGTSNHDGELVCQICFPNLIIYGEVLPGYLMIESLDEPGRRYPTFGPGSIALTGEYHDLGYVLPARPLPDPTAGIPDDVLDDMTEDDPRWAGFREYLDCVDLCRPAFDGEPHAGYCLVKVGLDSGYNEETDGFFINWLIDRMARMIEAKKTEEQS